MSVLNLFGYVSLEPVPYIQQTITSGRGSELVAASLLGRFDGTHWGQGLVGVFLHSYTNALSFQGVWAEKLRRRSIILGASMSTERAPPPPFGSVRTVVTLDVAKSLPDLHEVSSGREAVVRGPVYSDVTAADLTNAMGALGDYTEV